MVRGSVTPPYRPLYERSLEIADIVMRHGGVVEDADAYDFARDLLTVNYWLDRSAVSHLQLLDESACGRIISAALDLNTLREQLKKNLQP